MTGGMFCRSQAYPGCADEAMTPKPQISHALLVDKKLLTLPIIGAKLSGMGVFYWVRCPMQPEYL